MLIKTVTGDYLNSKRVVRYHAGGVVNGSASIMAYVDASFTNSIVIADVGFDTIEDAQSALDILASTIDSVGSVNAGL